MDVKSTRAVADLLGVSRFQIDQWISRGQFLPALFTTRGMARNWTFDDALRLAIFIELIEIGVHPKSAGAATQIRMHALNGQTACFVAWQGASGAEEWTRTYEDAVELAGGGAWHSEFFPASQIGDFVARPAVLRSIVLPLDCIAKHLAARWG